MEADEMTWSPDAVMTHLQTGSKHHSPLESSSIPAYVNISLGHMPGAVLQAESHTGLDFMHM